MWDSLYLRIYIEHIWDAHNCLTDWFINLLIYVPESITIRSYFSSQTWRLHGVYEHSFTLLVYVTDWLAEWLITLTYVTG
jgi:hypothetical protein